MEKRQSDWKQTLIVKRLLITDVATLKIKIK